MKLVNKKKKKRFFLSDLWQDHLINDFVEKLIEIKRMTTQLTPNGSLHSTAYNSKLDTTLNPKEVYELNNNYLSLFHQRV